LIYLRLISEKYFCHESTKAMKHEKRKISCFPKFRVFVIVENVSNSQHKSNYFEINLREPNG
jgi:hypothetical protein